jgi:hypothetical protein
VANGSLTPAKVSGTAATLGANSFNGNQFINGTHVVTGGAVVLGNVGIGTGAPTSRLEILGQDGLAITGYQPFLTLRDTNAGNARGVISTGGHRVLIGRGRYVHKH